MQLITRLCLAFLLLTGLLVGVWALAVPTSFYSSFPGFGLTWVSIDGPYNEHLIRDVGAAYLMIAALSGLSIVRPAAAPPLAVGLATMGFNVPHLVYHTTHLAMYDPLDKVLNVAVLTTAVLCSGWLMTPQAAARAARR